MRHHNTSAFGPHRPGPMTTDRFSPEEDRDPRGRGRGPHRGGPRRGGPHHRRRRDAQFQEAFLGPEGDAGFRRGGPRPRGGPGRGRRGDVRAAVLALLAEGEFNGYQLMTEIAERSEGLWQPSAGSVYPALGQLEDEGLIAPTTIDGRKVFRLTEDGRAHVEAHADDLAEPWTRVAGPHRGYLDVRTEMRQLGMALQQVVVTGDADQVAEARHVLDDARRSLYRVLAGDASTGDAPTGRHGDGPSDDGPPDEDPGDDRARGEGPDDDHRG